ARGRRAWLVNPGPIPEKYAFLTVSDAIASREDPGWWRDFGLFGVLDCGDLDRLPEINREAARRLPVFNLDHHVSSAGIGEAIWREDSASSTCEMVTRLVRQAGWELPTPAAQALWTGIVTDTGRFSQENATPAALEAAHLCLLAGADPVLTDLNIFQSTGVAERRLQGRMLERMRLLAEGRLAVSTLRREDFLAAGADPGGSYELVWLLRGTAGVEVSILILETGSGGVRATLRAAKPHDALRLAGRFGGGGHVRAAGCSLSAGLAEAEEALVRAALEEFWPGEPYFSLSR
ncbi:MAG: hypothetical protein LBV15_05475, partial [Planctomycetota bacterium]|nr:hypothetical protein [Planctomycetota bacterium]